MPVHWLIWSKSITSALDNTSQPRHRNTKQESCLKMTELELVWAPFELWKSHMIQWIWDICRRILAFQCPLASWKWVHMINTHTHTKLMSFTNRPPQELVQRLSFTAKDLWCLWKRVHEEGGNASNYLTVFKNNYFLTICLRNCHRNLEIITMRSTVELEWIDPLFYEEFVYTVIPSPTINKFTWTRSKITLVNYQVIVKRYVFSNGVVGGLIPVARSSLYLTEEGKN